MRNLFCNVAASLLLISAGNALASSPPTIHSACSIRTGSVISISGVLSDPDNDPVSVAPLVVGVCVNGLIPNYTYPASYNCNVPGTATAVTLVAADSAGNFSTPVYVDLTTVPSCTFY